MITEPQDGYTIEKLQRALVTGEALRVEMEREIARLKDLLAERTCEVAASK